MSMSLALTSLGENVFGMHVVSSLTVHFLKYIYDSIHFSCQNCSDLRLTWLITFTFTCLFQGHQPERRTEAEGVAGAGRVLRRRCVSAG